MAKFNQEFDKIISDPVDPTDGLLDLLQDVFTLKNGRPSVNWFALARIGTRVIAYLAAIWLKKHIK